ncbi:MAG: hypothetical protein MUO90_03365 [Dehalococcoidales bacterium]|nr:hypothetical protein [Dehalococcoidales bacterium]
MPVVTISKVSFILIHNLDWANYHSHQPGEKSTEGTGLLITELLSN